MQRQTESQIKAFSEKTPKVVLLSQLSLPNKNMAFVNNQTYSSNKKVHRQNLKIIKDHVMEEEQSYFHTSKKAPSPALDSYQQSHLNRSVDQQRLNPNKSKQEINKTNPLPFIKKGIENYIQERTMARQRKQIQEAKKIAQANNTSTRSVANKTFKSPSEPIKVTKFQKEHMLNEPDFMMMRVKRYNDSSTGNMNSKSLMQQQSPKNQLQKRLHQRPQENVNLSAISDVYNQCQQEMVGLNKKRIIVSPNKVVSQGKILEMFEPYKRQIDILMQQHKKKKSFSGNLNMLVDEKYNTSGQGDSQFSLALKQLGFYYEFESKSKNQMIPTVKNGALMSAGGMNNYSRAAGIKKHLIGNSQSEKEKQKYPYQLSPIYQDYLMNREKSVKKPKCLLNVEKINLSEAESRTTDPLYTDSGMFALQGTHHKGKVDKDFIKNQHLQREKHRQTMKKMKNRSKINQIQQQDINLLKETSTNRSLEQIVEPDQQNKNLRFFNFSKNNSVRRNNTGDSHRSQESETDEQKQKQAQKTNESQKNSDKCEGAVQEQLSLLSPKRKKQQTKRKPFRLPFQTYFYRDLIWKMNYSNGMFVETPIEYEHRLKAYIGKGNNSSMIMGLVKRRIWFAVTDKLEDANFVWTQLKQLSYYKLQEKLAVEDSSVKSDSKKLKSEANGLKQQSIAQNTNQQDCRSKQVKPQNTSKINYESKILSNSCQDTYKQYFQKYHSFEQKTTEQLQSRLATKHFKYEKIIKAPSIKEQKMQNHLLHNYVIGNKKALFSTMSNYYSQKGSDVFDFLPLTFHIVKGTEDENYYKFLKYFYKKNKQIAQGKRAKEEALKEENSVKGKTKSDKKSSQKQNKQSSSVQKMPASSSPSGQIGSNQAPLPAPPEHNVWIVKPGENSNRGNGIQVCFTLDQIKAILKTNTKYQDGSSKTFIIQSYIDRPLLYQKRKFDIRHFIMMTCINGKVKGYWFKDGYIRTTSNEYNLKGNSGKVHLTNDAIQKRLDDYGKYEKGNKISYEELEHYINYGSSKNRNFMVSSPSKKKKPAEEGSSFRADNNDRTKRQNDSHKGSKKFTFQQHIIPQMKKISTDIMRACSGSIDPLKHSNNFEIYGLDFMIDCNFKTWLIEVNSNPCLQLSCPLLGSIIPRMIENALEITMDCMYPPPVRYTPKGVHYYKDLQKENGFEMVYDETKEGLWKGAQIDTGMLYEEDDTFEDSGDEWQED